MCENDRRCKINEYKANDETRTTSIVLSAIFVKSSNGDR